MQHDQNFSAGGNRLADKSMHRLNSKRPGAASRETLDQLLGADKKVLDNLLVVFHRGTLRDDERDDSGPPGRKLVHPEHAARNVNLRIGILEHRVFLADDLGGELGQDLCEPPEQALAMFRGNVVSDYRTERKNVETAVRPYGHKQLERRGLRLGKSLSHLAQREIFLECSREELM